MLNNLYLPVPFNSFFNSLHQAKYAYTPSPKSDFLSWIFNVLGVLNHEENITMLLVEQNVRIALSIASYGYLLETGRIVLHGTSKDLAQNEDIKEFYLGLNLSGGRKSYRDVKHYKRRKRWLG